MSSFNSILNNTIFNRNSYRTGAFIGCAIGSVAIPSMNLYSYLKKKTNPTFDMSLSEYVRCIPYGMFFGFLTGLMYPIAIMTLPSVFLLNTFVKKDSDTEK
jgi:hypothetical protein